MPFFEPLPPEPEPEIPQDEWGPPLWDRPSEAVLGAAVGISALLARTDRFALAFENVTAHPNGFTFDFVVMGNPMVMQHEQGMGLWRGRLRGPRFGLEFANRTRAASFMRGGSRAVEPAYDENGFPTSPILSNTGGYGNNERYVTSGWCFPLPPHGPITVYAEWAKEGIDESSAIIDGDAIRDASTRAITLWEYTS